MRFAPVRGVIERRLLVIYRLDPKVAKEVLPPPWQARLIGGYAVAGIALAHLGRLRPAGLPPVAGLARESVTHGIAVEWESSRSLHTGVFVTHHDSAGAGRGRRLCRASRFTVDERTDGLRVAYTGRDRTVRVDIDVDLVASLAGSALFADVYAATRFLQLDGAGGAAWAPPAKAIRLCAGDRSVGAARVLSTSSTVFADTSVFPPGSVHLDSALLMRDLVLAPAPLERVRGARRAAAPTLA